jgi:two-component system, NarL family, sensor histidine kinase DevS
MSDDSAMPREVVAEALEHVDDGIALVDRSGTIRYATGRMASLFGYEPDELVGRAVEALVPPDAIDDHASAREAFIRVGGSRPMAAPCLDIEGLRHDGTRLAVDIQLSPLTEELFLVAVRDASEARTRAADLALARADLDANRRRVDAQRASMDFVVQHVFGATAQLDALRRVAPPGFADELEACIAALHHALDGATSATPSAPVPDRLAPAAD